MTSTPINPFDIESAERHAQCKATAEAIFNQFSLAPRKHGNRWYAEMVNADGATFGEVFSNIIDGSATFGAYKTKRDAASHTLSNGETYNFKRLCHTVAWELV